MPEIPANAKKPADKKPKAEKVEEPTTVTATVSGKEWVVPVEALDDFELLDDFNVLEADGDISRLPAILKRLLGDEQWRDALNTIRDEKTGRVSIEAGADFVNSLMGEINPNS